MTDSFCESLNACMGEVPKIPRVRFEVGLGEDAAKWLDKKHQGGQVHEPAMLAAFLAIRDRFNCRMAFDVGALFGYFTIACQTIFKCDVVAFEMHKAAIGPLSRNIQGAKYLEAAISDECRKGVKVWVSGFNIYEKPEGGWEELDNIPGAMKPRGVDNRGRGFMRINFVTLDWFCEQTGYLPDVIKIDVEGYQAKAVRGMMGIVERHRPAVVIELHDPEKLARFGTTNKETVKPLFDMGYRGYWCGDHRSTEAKFERVADMDERHEKLSLMVLIP